MRRNELITNLTKNSNDTLYTNFVEQFYVYVPNDYFDIFTESELELFCKQSFEFIKNADVTRKLGFEQITSPKNFAIFHVVGSNKPFIVDTIKTLLSDNNLAYDFFIHPVMPLVRNAKGELIGIGSGNDLKSLVCIAIHDKINNELVEEILHGIKTILNKVDITCDSWKLILESIDTSIKMISLDNPEAVESKEFLEWLKKDNFTFFGNIDFEAENSANMKIIGDSEIWGDKEEISYIINTAKSSSSKSLIEFGKIQKVSAVHRSSFLDYIMIKKFDGKGKLVSGKLIIGLYGSNLPYQSIKNIPIIRGKLSYILEKTKFLPVGYNAKKLKLIVESLPRIALFHIDKDELYELCMSTLSAMTVGNLKFFRVGSCKQNFAEIIIFMPRERFTPKVHQKIQAYLQEKFGIKLLRSYITEITQNFIFLYTTFASDSCNELSQIPNQDFEKDLEMLTSLWESSFKLACKKLYDSNLAYSYITKYGGSFPHDYQYTGSPQEAAIDVSYLDKLSVDNPILFNLSINSKKQIYLKIFSSKGKLTLSETMPLLENLGFAVLEEQAYNLDNYNNLCIHRYSISLKNELENFEEVKSIVEQALYAITQKKTSTDFLSKLITYSKLSWREVDLIRTLAYYMHQTNLTYDYKYVSENLIKHFEYTKKLITFFDYKFNPIKHDIIDAEKVAESLIQYLSVVTSSAEDRVLRTMLHIIEAAVRTNYYQTNNGQPKTYISIKFNSSKVPHLPQPVPYAEIFVFSNDFEAIHLRGGKVARGGMRWSDRGEDYRVEILGLMKAQMTKNSVIVPVGSKGGFFLRFSPDSIGKNEYMQRAINCYQNFLRGLLDITDNIIGTSIVKPKDSVIYDEDDPYLVVAADKGTATFSDYANEISNEYNFWLGDAFASGGSAGYDHKKMAITARGAWISVQRHFKEIGLDVQKDNITVIGIGDMSGDVFGNGMLMSESIKLIAAFNHVHIFIDPDPDPQTSFMERKRLFELPGSKWSDYSPNVISKGGAIFERQAKSIKLTEEIQTLLGINHVEIIPDDLIRHILLAKAHLLWNGGIGTYIKASSEENYTIGDKTNDNLRVNGKDMKVKVIGEGGNLGASQKGRVEYAKFGGRINTDFIDNSAGVDCSDHEVNIKIALAKAIETEKLNLKDRNNLLAKMTNDVAELVLEDNKHQTLALTIMEHSSIFTVESFSKFIDVLEEEKLLQRNVEFIPTNSELLQRANNREKLTRPELAILLSYSKRSVYNKLQNSLLVTEDYFNNWLIDYFPVTMREKYKEEILTHQLRKEIILTEITNKLVNQLSGPIINALEYETGAKLCDIARGFVIVLEIFNLNSLWLEAEKLPSSIPLNVMMEIYTDINKVIRRGITWMITNLEHPLKINPSIETYKEEALKISTMITHNLSGSAKDKFDNKYKKYKEAGVPKVLAERCSKLESLISSFDIAFISNDTGAAAESICETYFIIGNKYHIDWLRKTCDRLMTESYWQRLSLQSLKDDLYDKQRKIIKLVIRDKKLNKLDEWFIKNEQYSNIFDDFIENMMQQENVDINMIILATKKLEIFIRKA